MDHKTLWSTFVFLFFNFLALYLGALFTDAGVNSDWYQNAQKAPWTPPGWMFGAAWSLIMVCYALYMAKVWNTISNRKVLIGLYAFQWVLNVLWNPLFFYYHWVWSAEIVLIFLTILLIYKLIVFSKHAITAGIFLLPYIFWLFIANSLNLYFAIKN